jgi:predicted DNA-binding transcriptional regulator AlpA
MASAWLPAFTRPGPSVANFAEAGRWASSCTQEDARIRAGIMRFRFSSPEGESSWTSGCAGRSGGVRRIAGAALQDRGVEMPGAEQGRDARERGRVRDKLTIAEVCADLGISRRTFYEWRAKNRAPRCITLPNGSLRVRRSEYQRWLVAREEGSALNHLLMSPKSCRGSRATALPCRRWPMPRSPGKSSIRPPAAWMGRSRRRARLAATARSWPTQWITRLS